MSGFLFSTVDITLPLWAWMLLVVALVSALMSVVAAFMKEKKDHERVAREQEMRKAKSAMFHDLEKKHNELVEKVAGGFDRGVDLTPPSSPEQDAERPGPGSSN